MLPSKTIRLLSLVGSLGTVSIPLFGSSIQITNDSVFPLTAEVYNAQGMLETSIPLESNQMHIWYSDESPFRPNMNRPYTPYTVRFICRTGQPYDYSTNKKKNKDAPKYESEFGAWENVSTGAHITAQGCTSGPRTCVIKKQKKEKSKKGTDRNKKTKTDQENSGENNWSNDGGQTWTNDGGPGWDDNDGSSDNDGGPGWNNDDDSS